MTRLLLIFLATLLVSLAACSGGKGGRTRPTAPGVKAPCDKPDAGTVDQGSKGYYQIGTCPVDENEGAEVIDDE